MKVALLALKAALLLTIAALLAGCGGGGGLPLDNLTVAQAAAAGGFWPRRSSRSSVDITQIAGLYRYGNFLVHGDAFVVTISVHIHIRGRSAIELELGDSCAVRGLVA